MSIAVDLSVYLVTDTALCGSFGVAPTIRAAAAAGVSVVQLRDPAATDDEIVDLGREVAAVLAGTGVPLLVNDRVHLVAAIGADGAHIGQDDVDVRTARQLLGPGALLGLSVQTTGHVRRAVQDGTGLISYLGVGPVWPQTTKPDAAPACGLDGLAAMTAASPWPCVAIGGVTADRAAAVKGHGAAGMAVVSAVCGQPDPAAAARGLRLAWDTAGRASS